MSGTRVLGLGAFLTALLALVFLTWGPQAPTPLEDLRFPRLVQQRLGTPWCRTYILDPARKGYVRC